MKKFGYIYTEEDLHKELLSVINETPEERQRRKELLFKLDPNAEKRNNESWEKSMDEYINNYKEEV